MGEGEGAELGSSVSPAVLRSFGATLLMMRGGRELEGGEGVKGGGDCCL